MKKIIARVKKSLRFNDDFELDVRRTYFRLRTAAGLLGVALPTVLVAYGLSNGMAWHKMTSLSSFYWLSLDPPIGADAFLRTWFVSSLIAVGCCLIVYQGYGRLEDWLLNLAGLAAIVVALNPMPWRRMHTDPMHVHYISASIFFLLIAATIWFCARDTLPEIRDIKTRARWNRLYQSFAIAMFIVPGIAFFVSGHHQRTIWIETAGVWVFSAFWFAKTHELSRLSRMEPRAEAIPKIRRVAGRLEVTR